ncbi:MAG: class II fructose-bisphosphate aldolase [Bacillota bacterium]|nr:hypothetical protein [Candidatus Fermentithermobacillaceae bacterium]
MKNTPVSGKRLYTLFEAYNPFGPDLGLRPPEERKTVLAANANFPFGLELAGFLQAAALDGGSPIIIQFSGSALAREGRGVAGSREVPYLKALRLGARMGLTVLESYMDAYNPPFVAVALDHFAVPDVDKARQDDDCHEEARPYLVGRQSAVSMLNQALEASSAYGVPAPDKDQVEMWVGYLSSGSYANAVAGFVACLEALKPAWAMIDTEEMPPALNYAVTRHICNLVKDRGFDAVLEAEYGATGQAGSGEGYVRLYGEELHKFARQIAGFVKYTGARGISYPIGMEHAAPLGRRHEPDTLRLETVQREIIKEAGYYAPFAQHGGTGARQLARGLVAKNNVNAHFLVTMARNLLKHFIENKEAVEQGHKSACGSDIYIAAAQAVCRAAVEKMKEAGTYGWFGHGLP